MFCRDRDRPTDRPTGPDRPSQTNLFEENAGFAFCSRTQTISRESNVILLILFQIRHHRFRTQTIFSADAGEVGSDGPKREREVLRWHFDTSTVLCCKHENSTDTKGLLRELNPGPLAPEARIIPLDQAASGMLIGRQAIWGGDLRPLIRPLKASYL